MSATRYHVRIEYVGRGYEPTAELVYEEETDGEYVSAADHARCVAEAVPLIADYIGMAGELIEMIHAHTPGLVREIVAADECVRKAQQWLMKWEERGIK